mgnify:CR=1 FL=1
MSAKIATIRQQQPNTHFFRNQRPIYIRSSSKCVSKVDFDGWNIDEMDIRTYVRAKYNLILSTLPQV